jgi:hypothetical protein
MLMISRSTLCHVVATVSIKYCKSRYKPVRESVEAKQQVLRHRKQSCVFTTARCVRELLGSIDKPELLSIKPIDCLFSRLIALFALVTYTRSLSFLCSALQCTRQILRLQSRPKHGKKGRERERERE